MGHRTGTTVGMRQGRYTRVKPIASNRLDELLGIPDPVAQAEAERAAELAAYRESVRLGHIDCGHPAPRARDLKAWAKNEQRVAEQEEAAQKQKWADVIGKEEFPNQG